MSSINPVTDFTLSTLRDYLTEKFGNKKSGEKFNIQDIQSYIKRGHLPKYLGGETIVRRLVLNRPVLCIQQFSKKDRKKRTMKQKENV